MVRASVFSLVLVSSASAQEAFWPDVSYDPSVPTIEQVLGHAPGDRIVSHAEMLEYLEALSEARPAQIQVHEYARTWGGRTNHYYFDLNRDWLALTQPETQGHVRAILESFSQIFIALHETGGNSTYYFTPEADPLQPSHHFGPERNARCLRTQQREVVRHLRISLLHARDLRRLLPGLRRELAAFSRHTRGDLRASVGTWARVPAK